MMAGNNTKRKREVETATPQKLIDTSTSQDSSPEKRCRNDDENAKERLKNAYRGLPFDEDVMIVHQLAVKLNPTNPRHAFEAIGVTLVGPFDVLCGQGEADREKDYLMECRHRFDPPETTTVFEASRKSEDGLHWALFRDSPDELPKFVASNNSSKNALFESVGDNLLSALLSIAKARAKAADKAKKGSTWHKSSIERIMKSLSAAAEEEGLPLDANASFVKRKKCVVGQTLSKLGIVVTVVNDVGYRPSSMSLTGLEKLLKKIDQTNGEGPQGVKARDQLDELISYANIANDECDFGMPLELGLNIMSGSSSGILDGDAKNLLVGAYKLLKRPLFAEIADKHLASRARKMV